MNKIISSSEIIGRFHDSGEEWEVCACGEGSYEETGSQLSVELRAFLRAVKPADPAPHAETVPDWMPKPQVVRANVSREEAGDMARDIFHSWVGRVRHAVPHPLYS